MAGLYLVTAGTSLLENYDKHRTADDRKIECGLPPSIRDIFTQPTGWLNALDFDNNIVDWALRKWASLDLDNDDGWATAEIASLYRLPELMRNGQRFLPQGANVVFLASSTVEGVFCALINACLLSLVEQLPVCVRKRTRGNWEDGGHNFEVVGEIKWHIGAEITPHRNLPQVDNSIIVEIIDGLTPTKKPAFENDGIYNLIRTITEWKYSSEWSAEKIIFTGGYKASLPVITQAAIWLKGMPMSSLYEKAPDLVDIPLIPVFPDSEQCQAVYWLGSNKDSDIRKRWANLAAITRGKIKPLLKDGPSGLEYSIVGTVLYAILYQMRSQDDRDGNAIRKKLGLG